MKELLILILSFLVLVIVKAGPIIALILMGFGVVTIDCVIIVFYMCISLLYFEAMYGNKKGRK